MLPICLHIMREGRLLNRTPPVGRGYRWQCQPAGGDVHPGVRAGLTAPRCGRGLITAPVNDSLPVTILTYVMEKVRPPSQISHVP